MSEQRPIDQGANYECMNEIRVFMPHVMRGRGPRALPYREPNCAQHGRTCITAVPFVVLWVLMWAALGTGYWVGLLLAVPAPASSCACS